MMQLIPTRDEMATINEIADIYFTTGYFLAGNKDARRKITKDELKTMMFMAWGIGIPVTQGVEIFNILHGKLALTANAEASIMMRAGYTWRVIELTDKLAHIEVFLPNGHVAGDFSFTIEDAKRADLLKGNKNWITYPQNMLMARVLSNAAKWCAPDMLGGATPYTVDELDGHDVPAPEGMIADTDLEAEQPPVGTPVTPDVPDTDASGQEVEPENVTPMFDDNIDEIEPLYAPVGDKGNISTHNHNQLFAVAREYALQLGADKLKDSERHALSMEHLGKDCESWTQLNNSGALKLMMVMKRLIVHELGLRCYEDEWDSNLKRLLLSVDKKRQFTQLDELPRTHLENLIKVLKGELLKREAESA